MLEFREYVRDLKRVFRLGHLGTAGITEKGRRWTEKENGQDECMTECDRVRN